MNIHHLNPFSSFIYELDQRIVNESHNNEKDNRQGDEDIVDLDDLVNKQPLISSPFSQSERIYHLDMWKPPRHYSKAEIEFEKPPNNKFASFTSSAALVQRLQKILEEKERNNNLLRKHLLKIHKESSILAEEVARRERPDGATLYRENNLLKDQLERCLRENALLRGLYMQSTNTALKKLKETEELNSRFQLQSRVHSAPSKICPDGSKAEDENEISVSK
ncbi:hypothetical protein EB796_016038 [Bugula neritina]|uniref:Uncharacterized protein n=1 Tax=Bugula neritina TaxID=10212 RepID=A0A7J7JI91_BUGNE|nr:hypothetical protein EB796_016038 [Bugula neritina]